MKTYWWLFNILMRLLGVGFTLVGTGFALWGLSLLSEPQSTINNGSIPTTDPWEKASPLIVGLVTGSMGVLLLRARRYRPDLGDTPFTPHKNAPPKDPVYKTKFP